MYDAPELRRDRGVEVDDRTRHALERCERSLDQIPSGLGQALDLHVVGDAGVLDQMADEVEFGLRGRGKADLDLLETDLEQHFEEALLLFAVHGVDERLVAVAQIGRQPAWRRAGAAGRQLRGRT